jgi:hypothetical protein
VFLIRSLYVVLWCPTHPVAHALHQKITAHLRFTCCQNNSQLQSQNKNYRRQDGFDQNNRELKSKNK